MGATKNCLQSWAWLLNTKNTPAAKVVKNQSILANPEDYELAVRTLVCTVHSASTSEASSTQPAKSLQDIARHMSDQARTYAVNATLAGAIASFKKLVLWSMCVLLEKRGVSSEIVDAIHHWTSHSQRIRERCLKGTDMIHRLICTLEQQHGWSRAEATQLIFLGAPSARTVSRLSEAGIEMCATSLSRQREQSTRPTLQFTIPGVLWKMLESYNLSDKPSHGDLCAALGYDRDEASPSLRVTSNRESSQQLRFVNSTQSDMADLCGNISIAFECTSVRFKTLAQLVSFATHMECRRDILYRGLAPQYRWNRYGNNITVPLSASGVDDHIRALFQNESTLDAAIAEGLDIGLLSQQTSDDGSATYRLADAALSADEVVPRSNTLLFFCHIFPRDLGLDDSFSAICRKVFPWIQACWETLQHISFPSLLESSPGLREDLIEIFSIASRLNILRQGIEHAEIAKGLLDHSSSPHLKLGLARAESVALRSKGLVSDSDRVVKEAMEIYAVSGDTTDVRSSSAIDQLHLSLVENAFLENRFDDAKAALEKVYDEVNNPTEVQMSVSRLRATVMGRYYQFTGDFQQARSCFEICLNICTVQKSEARFHLLRHQADVLCELQEPAAAIAMLKPALTELVDGGRSGSKPYRRLSLSYAEALLGCEEWEKAQAVLSDADALLSAQKELDQTDQLDHVRAHLGMLRVAMRQERWSAAMNISENALRLVERYNSFSETNYYKGVLLDVQAALHLRAAVQQAHASRRCKRDARHFMPGLGTSEPEILYTWINESVQSIVSIFGPCQELVRDNAELGDVDMT